MTSPWARRATGLVLLVALAQLVFALLDFEPRLVPVALLATVVVAAGWLVLDALGAEPARWPTELEAAPVAVGEDPRLATYRRVVEDHVTARTPHAALRDRLLHLARDRDPGLTDPVLRELAETPLRRMTRTEIDRYLRRIEEL